MKKTYVKCSVCGKTDKPDKAIIPHNIGTSTKMICPDCSDEPNNKAIKCRNCCPTGHGTR